MSLVGRNNFFLASLTPWGKGEHILFHFCLATVGQLLPQKKFYFFSLIIFLGGKSFFPQLLKSLLPDDYRCTFLQFLDRDIGEAIRKHRRVSTVCFVSQGKCSFVAL